MKNISVVTLGCKVNQYDTAAILNNLPRSKYRRNNNFTDQADIYIIDTCTVTHKADAEARNYISKARRSNPNGVIVVTGCYAQVSPEEISQLEGVDYVVGNSHKFNSLLKIVREGRPQEEPSVFISDIFREKKRSFSTPDISYFPERTRAFLKVQDGCNYACTFCIIPRARGRSRSLEPEEITRRIRKLSENGYREIVLTGIHLASYGKDIGIDLLTLLREIDDKKLISRVRLSSLDPADLNEELISFCSDSEVICPSFHISLQSGDEDILKRMRRRYKPSDFIKWTDKIRNLMPDASIGTDLMTGFPGETDAQFQNTYDLAKNSELTYFHVFPYSPRKNTSASTMDGNVHSRIKKDRSRALRKLGDIKKNEFYKKFIGKKLMGIVESKNSGTTDNYINLKFNNSVSEIGKQVEVKILTVEKHNAIASIVKNF